MSVQHNYFRTFPLVLSPIFQVVRLNVKFSCLNYPSNAIFWFLIENLVIIFDVTSLKANLKYSKKSLISNESRHVTVQTISSCRTINLMALQRKGIKALVNLI